MKIHLVNLALCLCFIPQARGGDADVIVDDPLKGKLGPGWEWLRENAGTWRQSPKGLEIKVEPGLADTVKNALLRKAPDRSQARYAIDVTVESTAPPTQQYEQLGLTWYRDGKPAFKLVHEFIDGKTYIIPGKKPTETRLLQLRLIVGKEDYVAQYRPDAKGEFLTADKGKLPAARVEQISIQCYHGPTDQEHWMRFSDFRITRLPGGQTEQKSLEQREAEMVEWERQMQLEDSEFAIQNKKTIAELTKELGTARQIDVFRLRPRPLGDEELKGAKRHLHGYEIVAEARAGSEEQRKGIVAFVGKNLHWDETRKALCFNPRHGLRVVCGKRTLDFVICFECNQCKVFDGETYLRSLPTRFVDEDNSIERFLRESERSRERK